MATEYKAKDCLPFEKQENPKKVTLMDNAMKQFSNYWSESKGRADGADEPIVSLKTFPPDSQSSDQSFTTQWCAGRYIGLAHLNVPKPTKGTEEVKISIRPRFGQSFLLDILEDLYNIKVTKQDGESSLASSEWFGNLLSLLKSRLWVDKCQKANRYGLPRKNERREHQGVVLHGALDVRQTIMPLLTKKEIHTHTYEKALDDHICRIIYEAYRILLRKKIFLEKKTYKKNKEQNNGLGFSMPPAVQETIDKLNSQFKGFAFDLTENDYQRIRYKSIYLSWKPLVDFSWAIIRERQIGFKSANSKTDCIFVDMAEIWESYLRKKLGEGLKDEGWQMLTVEECKHTIYRGAFFERKIIPDLVLKRDNEYIVFDAKYKRMRGEKTSFGEESDVDRNDLFQIHTYTQFFQHQKDKKVVLAGLLYPITSEEDFSQETDRPFYIDNLFGKEYEGKDQIPFIIDGIYCKEIENDKESGEKIGEEQINNMIMRIKSVIKKKKQG